MKRFRRPILSGFAFGTVGLFFLALIGLVSHSFEVISIPFMLFGRVLSDLLLGSAATDAEVVLLTVANGLFYALVFTSLAWGFGKVRK